MVPSTPKTKPKKAKAKKASKPKKSRAWPVIPPVAAERSPAPLVAKNPDRMKAVSLWTSGKDRALFERARKRFGDSLSELVRVLVAAYDDGKVVLTDGTVEVRAPGRAG